MSLTMGRMCGFLSVAHEHSNTSKLPSINWKLKNSAIILNKWQANSYTTPMIKQMTSFSTFFVTKLDCSCIYVKYEWEGGSLSGCSNNEIGAPPPPSRALQQRLATSWQVFPWFTLDPTLVSFQCPEQGDTLSQTPKDLLTWHSITSKCCWVRGQEVCCTKSQSSVRAQSLIRVSSSSNIWVLDSWLRRTNAAGLTNPRVRHVPLTWKLIKAWADFYFAQIPCIEG